MHFFSTLLVAAAATINAVSGATVCYPSPCNTYTSQSPDSAANGQLTVWGTDVGLDKFNQQLGTLTKVTIKTVFKFETTSYVTCTSNTTFCANTYAGSSSPSIKFSMDLKDSPDILPQYWGRWGDYPYDSSGGFPPPNNKDIALDNNGKPMFVNYTYPIFDMLNYVPDVQNPEMIEADTCSIGACTVWAYYKPTIDNKVELFYNNNETGVFVSYDAGQGAYTTEAVELPPLLLYRFGQEVGSTFPTPYNTEVELGTKSYDTVTDNKPIIKTITAGDPSGGINQDITTQSVLNLFQAPTSGSQIEFHADAVGAITKHDIGGNSAQRQTTYAFVQMAVEYEYDPAPATTNQDPQFVGFQGQSFQVHGYPGSYFHLISAPTFQMNGRFAYLANGHCHYKHTPCWTHPGTYIDDVTFIIDELLVRVTAGPVGTGYSVRINDEPFHAHAHGTNESDHSDVREFVPTKFYDAATRLTVHLRSPLQITIRTDLFAFTLHNADHFFNIDSQLLVRPILAAGREASSKYPHPDTGKAWFPEYPIHGFIGQTWANATYAHKKLYQGDVDDYVETRPYSTESIYSQYNKQFDDKEMHWD